MKIYGMTCFSGEDRVKRSWASHYQLFIGKKKKEMGEGSHE